MGAGQSKIADPELRHDQAPTTPPAIDPRSSTSDITQGIIISNNNPNTNYMYGSGTIVNNNQIVNQIFHGDLPKISDSIQIKIKSALQGQHVPQAVYNAQLSCGCMDGTRVKIIREINTWIKNPEASPIFWLTGMAGTGKTAIAWTICSCASKDPDIVLGGTFFCSRSTGLVAQRDVRCVIPTLAQLLARQSTLFGEALAAELARDPDVVHKQVGAQVEQLLYIPLLALKDSPVPILFVIDALDECSEQTTNSGSDGGQAHRMISAMLEALVAISRSVVNLPVKFLVTSRPETHIRDTPVSDIAFSTVLRLHTVDKEQVQEDIRLYISTRLSSNQQLRTRFRGDDVDRLARLCDSLFIVAATALQHILSAGIDTAVLRLQTLLDTSRDGCITAAVAPVDRMYALILAEAARVEKARTEIDELGDLRQLLAALLCARRTLSIAALADLLNRPKDQVRSSLSRLHAVVHVPEDDEWPGLCSLHASFGDYLFGRAPSPIRISESLGDEVLARACLHVMAKRLRFNVSQSHTSCERNIRSEPKNIPLSLKYACLQWIYHVSGIPEPRGLDTDINVIFRPRFLFWLEVTSVLDRVGRACAMLLYAASMVQLTDLALFLRDAHSFVASSREAIEKSAPHIYLSALPFAPKDSLVYKTFIPLCAGIVSVETSGIYRHGDRLVMSLTGAEDISNSISYSLNGCLIAAGSKTGTIRVWSTRTGEETMSPLRSGDGQVLCVAFSPKDQSLAAGTQNGTLCIWGDPEDDIIPLRLHGHSGKVHSLAFSPNGSVLATTSSDKTICLWSVRDGENISLIRGHSAEVVAVTFSPAEAILASGSHDQTIRLWHAATGIPVRQPLISHTSRVLSVSFSPDGKKLASGSESEIFLWAPRTGTTIAKLQSHSGWIKSLHFSPKGDSLLSASSSHGVRLWTLEQIASQSLSIVPDAQVATFSPDGLFIALVSADYVIQIWDAGNEKTAVQPLEAPGSVVHSVAISPDGAFIASGCNDHSVRIWNGKTGEPRSPPLLGHTGVVLSVAISPDGHTIASASWDCTIRLWDARTGMAIGEPLRGHGRAVSTVAFSPNALWLASGSLDMTVRIWSVTTGQASHLKPLRCNSCVRTVTYSPNGWLLTAGDKNGFNHFWNPESGVALCEPLKRCDDIRAIGFSPDGARIYITDSQKVCVRDVRTNHELLVLKGHTDQVLSVAYSLDGRFIGTGSKDNTVRLWNAKTAVLVATLHGHGGWVQGVAFTPDGQSLVSCSWDMTIRVWEVNAACLITSSPATLSAALTSIGLDDGWLLGPSRELLLWVPKEYRGYLQVGPCTMSIASRRIFVTADQKGLYYGTNWTNCWRKDMLRSLSRS